MATAGLDIPFTVTTEDGKRHRSRIRLSDMARTEMKTGISLASFEEDDAKPPFSFMLTAAYFALKRTGKAPDNFEAWFDTVIDFQTEAEQQGESEAPSEQEALSTTSPA